MAGRGRDAPGFLAESRLLPRPAKPIHGVQDASLLSLHAVLESYKDRRRGQTSGKASSAAGKDMQLGSDVGSTRARESGSSSAAHRTDAADFEHLDVRAFLQAAIGTPESLPAPPSGQGPQAQQREKQTVEDESMGRASTGHPWQDALAQVYGPGWEAAGAHVHAWRGGTPSVPVEDGEAAGEMAMEARYRARRGAALAALQALQAAAATGGDDRVAR